ncbi:Gfo/Idh/MocA family oxidoreductase [Halalkalicoccus salilacus]|uniref:Gfo/Idh/MocA family oxidoreductase n=1 Tax=Halalkalicoccus sp. GCM10025704 TaxID=3252662 RepID=UPI00360B1D23
MAPRSRSRGRRRADGRRNPRAQHRPLPAGCGSDHRAGETASPDEPFAEVDQHVGFELAFPGGVGAACTASFTGYASSHLELLGTEGRIRVDPAFSHTTRRRIALERGDVRATVEGPEVDEIREQFDYFAAHVRTGRRPEPDGQDGLVDMRTIDAIYESAETGRRVDLER